MRVYNDAQKIAPDRDGVDLIDGLGRVGKLFEDDFAECEREVGYGAVVGFEESD
jgi:hypothetical protein